jgi:hypothetical protein
MILTKTRLSLGLAGLSVLALVALPYWADFSGEPETTVTTTVATANTTITLGAAPQQQPKALEPQIRYGHGAMMYVALD